MASAGAILAGTAIGAKRHGDVWPIVRLTLGINCCWMLTVGVLYWLVSVIGYIAILALVLAWRFASGRWRAGLPAPPVCAA